MRHSFFIRILCSGRVEHTKTGNTFCDFVEKHMKICKVDYVVLLIKRNKVLVLGLSESEKIYRRNNVGVDS